MSYLHADRRRILLIDQNSRKQNLRANVLRNYEIEVHTADNVSDAALLWRANSYDLILLSGSYQDEDPMISAAIRQVKPKQRIALLVGPPSYIREVSAPEKRTKPVRVEQPAPVAADAVSPELAQAAQWQQMVRKIVTDWYHQYTVS